MLRLSSKNTYWLLILLPVLLMIAFYVFPILRVLWLSVTEPRPGLSNYMELVSNVALRRMLWQTTRICLVVTGASLLLGYTVAYVMVNVSKLHLRRILFCILLSFWMSVLVRAFAWLVLLGPHGPINSILLDAGLIGEPLQLSRNEIGVVIGMVHYMIPYAVLPMYANMQGIDARLLLAARGLGASALGAVWWVFLPLSLPGIVAAGVLVFIFSLGFFITPAILGGGRITMVSEYISIQFSQTLQWGLGSMLAGTMLIAVFLLFGLMSQFVRPSEMFGGS